jgi:glycolate oxidase FAD binding subunit
MTTASLCPATESELSDALADALRAGARVAIRGGGTKRDIGAPDTDAQELDMRGLDGVVDYDPPELVLTVRAGTRLSTVQSLVASQNQMLAFEPFDHGPIFGRWPGEATIGGIVAAGVSGSQRLSAGGVRDHLLGVRAVSGRGELFVSGAKVVKNVTGYDLPKLIAGSWGRLAAITEVTLKVLPAPRTAVTCVLTSLDPEQAVAAMGTAMGSQAEVAAAAHLPGTKPLTAFRLQGFQASVAARARALARRLETFGSLVELTTAEADAFWADLRTLAPLPPDMPLWRISVPPSAGGRLVRRLDAHGAKWLLDHAGGLAWVAISDGETVRPAVAEAGGHAMLLRGPAALRASVATFHPPAPPLAALEARICRAFDPAGMFQIGRF